MTYQVKLKSGSPTSFVPTDPILEIVGRGKQAYLWIGNGDDGWCFATLDRAKARNFARKLLAATEEKKRTPKVNL